MSLLIPKLPPLQHENLADLTSKWFLSDRASMNFTVSSTKYKLKTDYFSLLKSLILLESEIQHNHSLRTSSCQKCHQCIKRQQYYPHFVGTTLTANTGLFREKVLLGFPYGHLNAGHVRGGQLWKVTLESKGMERAWIATLRPWGTLMGVKNEWHHQVVF